MLVVRWRLVMGVMALLVLGPFAGSANAERIVPFESIAGFELGASEDTVYERLGQPSAVTEGPVVGQRTIRYERRKLEFVLVESRVARVATESRAHKTPQGLGVGSRMATVRARLRGERCYRLRRSTICAVNRGPVSMEYVVIRNRVAVVGLSGSP